MKIEQATLAMQASHEYASEYEYAVASTISFRSVFAGAEAQAEAAAESGTAAGAATAATTTNAARNSEQQRLLLLLAQIVGRLLDFLAPGAASSSSSTASAGMAALDSGAALPAASAAGDAGGARPRLVMEWSRVATERIEEHESSDFAASGTVLTADGRALDFTLGLSLCRDYSCVRTAVEAASVELRDPLVINFAGESAELAGQCFSFDLDADGSCEMLPELVGASGYLAIDRNGDGCVNDGSELFGTTSGDGFADLAALDADGNHWLDEADAAFSTLRVWRHADGGQDGEGSLTTLADAGVGALYLGSTQTPFSLTDEDNRLLGQIRASGLYLNENGSAGTLQQIDLAV